MATGKEILTEDESIDALMDAFPGIEFEVVYEGIGDTWDFKEKPVLIGTYMRTEDTEMLKYGSKTETEMRRVYTIKTASGDLVAVWGSFALDRGLRDVATGKVIRITYQGKNIIDGTDKEVKDFIVEVAK